MTQEPNTPRTAAAAPHAHRATRGDLWETAAWLIMPLLAIAAVRFWRRAFTRGADRRRVVIYQHRGDA